MGAASLKALRHHAYIMLHSTQQMAHTAAYQTASDQRRSIAYNLVGGASTGHALAVIICRTSWLHKTFGALYQLEMFFCLGCVVGEQFNSQPCLH
jgi:hypothetical protein